MPLGYPTWRDARQQLAAHAAFSMRTAIEAVGHNKLRAGLTSLGILFGVASVIAMLAIGKGAEQEILEQAQDLHSLTPAFASDIWYWKPGWRSLEDLACEAGTGRSLHWSDPANTAALGPAL